MLYHLSHTGLSPGTKLFLTNLTVAPWTLIKRKVCKSYLTKATVKFPFSQFEFPLILTQNCTYQSQVQIVLDFQSERVLKDPQREATGRQRTLRRRAYRGLWKMAMSASLSHIELRGEHLVRMCLPSYHRHKLKKPVGQELENEPKHIFSFLSYRLRQQLKLTSTDRTVAASGTFMAIYTPVQGDAGLLPVYAPMALNAHRYPIVRGLTVQFSR